MKTLAEQIRLELELKTQTMGHCVIYEDELQRIWPIDEKDRETKIEQFAEKYGFHLSFYRQGLCAIFIKESREIPGYKRTQVHRKRSRQAISSAAKLKRRASPRGKCRAATILKAKPL
jgi:hypothetical protein